MTMSPEQMADFLEQELLREFRHAINDGLTHYEQTLVAHTVAIAAFLRQLPSEAQKIEARRLLRNQPCCKPATDEALRLLGLDTEPAQP